MNTNKERQIIPLTVAQRCELLKRNIWTKKECGAFCGYKPTSMRKFFKFMTEFPSSPRCVYRDETLRLLNTTAERELSICEEARKLSKE